MAAHGVFREATADRAVESVPLSQLSLELGHLYMEDFAAGPEHLRHQFRQIAPWAAAARSIHAAEIAPRRPRISTCFLVDDYFGRFSTPAEVLPVLLEAARDSGLAIDYLARESGCADSPGISPARLVEARLVADPAPGTDGSRPPTTVSGWLSNGQRSAAGGASEAMETQAPWTPPTQNGVKRHSIFVDVELWDEDSAGKRTWSCPFLAAVWQLLRLGLLRQSGTAVAAPVPWDASSFPADWDELPTVLQLNPRAAPFSAYRTLSILPGRFLPVEQAVRTILEQVAVESAVAEQILRRGGAEGLDLPAELVDRIDYAFVGTSRGRPY